MTKYYKAFNNDWTCRGFQYEVGKTYTHRGKVKLCEKGFHACKNPFDCWSYYDLVDTKFALVECKGKIKDHGNGSKLVTAEINMKAELKLPEFINAGVDYLMNLITDEPDDRYNTQQATSGYNTKQASSGYCTKQASSGYNTQQATSGNYTQQASSGNYTQQASSGNYTKQASSGDYTQQATSGDYAQQASSGDYTKQATSGNYTQQASSGYYTKQASSGYNTKQASSGDYTKQASSGDNTQQASSGDYTKQASSGDYTKHTCEGSDSVIASAGEKTCIKGVIGTWISLAEYKKGKCIGFATGCIGKSGLKPNTFYKAKNGKLTECER